jgi:UDP-N-acetylglucosamine diphosphorylase / glucose-1-phosphate thymidylyltransferase / UDP-N-acetylgalactosamine diphosphorylase / glucosamine-1-phosphate N-acetyltransferase / galactosamine-1-phosphate N-acetyltransferase
MKLIVPMAGRGARFAGSNYSLPKPLIPVAGKPMMHWAVQSLQSIPRSQVVVIALREHEAYGITKIICDALPDAEIILLPDVTEGQLCTVLAAHRFIDNDEDVLVASADTYVVSSLSADIANRSPETRGIISVADMPGDRWSFARTDELGRVVEVAEKVRISNYASTGLYYFASGRELVSVADEIINNREKTHGEYYVIPVYQKFIQRGWRVNISLADQMWDMGTPESLAAFAVRYSQQES